ncbi:hypothetical protein H8E52_01660 [bacterium]|nr:hypothetical protein [bacterium]
MLFLFAASPAQTQVIGFFSHENGQSCDVDIEPYVPVDVFLLIAWWPEWSGFGVTGARFGTTNFPENHGYPAGIITEHWSSDNIVGDLYTDFTIMFDEPVGAGQGFVTLGRLEFLMYDPGWIQQDHQVRITPGDDCECIVVYDNMGIPQYASKGYFTFNCRDICDDYCYLPPTLTREDSWSTVKALF